MSDDDFGDYGDRGGDMYSGELGGGDDDNNQFQSTARSTVVQNQPHDEEVALSESESFAHDDPPTAPRDASLIESNDMDEKPPVAAPPRTQSPITTTQRAAPSQSGEEAPGVYSAAEYAHLNVPDDVRNLFQYITRYKAQNIDLETKLKPFIPDYIPSIGGIDEFIKVPRPDGKPDFLGLKMLDEPAAKQSDPTVLTLQLRQLSKEAPGSKAEMVGRIEHTDDSKQKKIQQWIASISDIHKSKPPASVSYTKRMPDIDTLMQEWPPEMEAFLKTMKMPSGDMDLDLKTFSKLVCGLMDIPVYDNIIESLHVLFTLYLEFKTNPVFKQMFDLEDRYTGGDDGYTPGRFNPAAGVGSANVWSAEA